MTGVVGAARRLQTGQLPADQQQRYIGLLLVSAENMMMLANNLLEMPRLKAGKLVLTETIFDLRELINDVSAAITEPLRLRGWKFGSG